MTEKITESWKNILKWIEISNHHGLGAWSLKNLLWWLRWRPHWWQSLSGADSERTPSWSRIDLVTNTGTGSQLREF
jgi:hypothetical protein